MNNITKKQKQKNKKNELLKEEHFEIILILKKKVKKWEELPKRKKSAKVYSYRLSKVKKGRRQMKEVEKIMKNIFSWMCIKNGC